MAMTPLALDEHLAGGNVEGGRQGGAVPDIVVGHPLDVAQPQRQHGLGVVQGLDLAFLIHT